MHKALQEKGRAFIHSAITDDGILASTLESDNYRRIWSRDSVIVGLTGIELNDEKIVQGLKSSLLTLADNRQTSTGIIPSNVDPYSGRISYGSLAGRVDATTWFLVGCAQYYLHTGDKTFLERVMPALREAFKALEFWEYNGRGLVYSPLSGNWADEYPLHGYLLYDNVLRLWALQLWQKSGVFPELYEKEAQVKQMLITNFWGKPGDGEKYNPALFKREKCNCDYFISGFHPGELYSNFDLAGNALCLITGLYDEGKIEALEQYLNRIWKEVHHGLLPAFWPVIDESHSLWNALSNNYNYHFKNRPHHFHNGGIWPIWMGWFAYGMGLVGRADIKKDILAAYEQLWLKNNHEFFEYYDSLEYIAGGIHPLSFTAAGGIMMVSENYKL